MYIWSIRAFLIEIITAFKFKGVKSFAKIYESYLLLHVVFIVNFKYVPGGCEYIL